ncbi:uncharacterized protein PHACADRAFT_204012 [Phanerochaete carnosa HHB-10118-sp]|uniref:Chromo domain-containing protein n=1 Tax=Phanerochaete carnosa (strain HHB-10118-sp) TaxID=650164 RepID=K5XCZ6_PHACS|nr:uncharacterized protein PHACADRAFT_204012 [Phanerochaete carnosa HHB-10118-sp]EKM60867.1 hypothetical protein PHACADRAFT_204012 [Phanerochaete carnosa HHB-10118-sp]
MAKKKKFQEDDEEQFHVEVITKAKVNSAGDWDYYVRWAGYGPEADSWEPSENVEGCDRLLKSFWKHVGTDDNDYEEGCVFEAEPEWIEKEKEFFHAHFGEPEEVIRKKKKRQGSGTQKSVIGKAIMRKNAKGKTTLKKPTIENSESSDSEDDVPVTSKASSSKRGRQYQSDSASSSEDSDKPLRKAPRKFSVSKPKATKQDSISATKPSKGKEPARPRPSTPEHDPLFSEPSSPAMTVEKKLSEPTPTAPTSAANNVPLPPKSAAPNHKNREPKVKLMTLPMGSDAANFTETKRRLAERTGTVAKSASAPGPTPQPPAGQANTKKDPLKNLSFKKNKSVSGSIQRTSPTSPVVSQAGPSQDPRRPAATGWFPSGPQEPQTVESPVAEVGGGWGREQSPAPTGGWGAGAGWGRGQSPVTGGWGNTVGSGSADWTAPQQNSNAANSVPVDRPPDPRKAAMARRQPSPQEQQKKAAENFLASIMPEQLAAPMPEPTGNEMDVDAPAAPPPVTKKPDLPQTRIPKKWQWGGELYMETARNRAIPAARLCNISLSEPTEPRPGGIRLNLCCTAEISTLRLEKLHDITDVYLLLRACAPIQQHCKVSHRAIEDEATFNAFATYLSRRRQFTYARVHMDNNQVGVLLLVPTASHNICKALKVPEQLRQHALIAVLIPWKLTVEQYQKYEWQAAHGRLNLDDGHISLELGSKISDLSKKLTANPQLAQGLRLHHFNAADYDFFTRGVRKYCIWHYPSDGSPTDLGFETRLLVAILDEWNAERAGYKEDTRVVFVHVGSLHELHKLQALALRRYKRPELRFYSYGTHASVPPGRWGVREIYPVGGVATFSAKAILQDPFKVYELIEQFDEHPLWTCYIHPSVIAAVAKISYPGSDVISLLRQNDFFYRPLLDLITDGKISLLEAPPQSRQPRTAKDDISVMVDPGLQWAEWMLNLCDLDATGIMEESLRLFNEKHPKLLDKDLVSVIDQELIQDILWMQLEPVMMDNYRRFVMFTETRNELPQENGIEFVSIAEDFNFRDEYFGKP